jgi:hypothetical protein
MDCSTSQINVLVKKYISLLTWKQGVPLHFVDNVFVERRFQSQ